MNGSTEVLDLTAPERCALLLATLLQYARHPATPNSPRWVSFMVPDDFLDEAQEALAETMGCAAIERLTRERDEWAAKWQAERKKYAELRWPGLTGKVRALGA
jgi:hypothetical protein